MRTKSHPDSDRPWSGMFNNSEAGGAWKENLIIILLSPSPSITWLTENWKNENRKRMEKEKGEGKAPEAGIRARAIITKPKWHDNDSHH